MASFITAGNATNGLQVSSDNTGILQLKSGTGAGTTALTIDTSQNTTFAGQIRGNAASTPPTFADSAGTQIGTLCRAWVNFNGVTTATVRASFNVSSITRNGAGDYTINFTNAMPDANYNVICNSVLASTSSATGSAGVYGAFSTGASTKTTSAVRTLFGNSSSGVATDSAEANIAVFR